MASTGIPGKSKSEYVVEYLLHVLSEWGFTDLILMSDQEPAVSSLVEEVKKTLRRRVRNDVEQ